VSDPNADGLDAELGDVRRHVWLLVIGAVLLIGVGVTVWRARSAPVVSPNEQVRQEIVKAGVDPSSTLQYEHALYFASQSQAIIAVQRLRGDFEVGEPQRVDATADGLEWLVVARQEVALDLAGIDAVTRQMEALAAGLGGVYDGWGVPLPVGGAGNTVVTAADA
jgi:regulator of RNase E activity RraB